MLYPADNASGEVVALPLITVSWQLPLTLREHFLDTTRALLKKLLITFNTSMITNSIQIVNIQHSTVFKIHILINFPLEHIQLGRDQKI